MVTSTAVTSEADVNQFRKLETLGIEDPIDSKEDVAALRQFKATITEWENGRYLLT